jgi:hypothetical protein
VAGGGAAGGRGRRVDLAAGGVHAGGHGARAGRARAARPRSARRGR